MREILLVALLFSNLIYGQKAMETRAKMTLEEFNMIEPYGDPKYLTFNFEENLFEHIRGGIFSSYEKTYNSLTTGQKVLWEYLSLASQIRNGGITQYFWNYEGYFMQEFDLMLKIIKDSPFTQLLNEARNKYIENKYLVSNYKYLDEQPGKKMDYYRLWHDVIKGDQLDNYFLANIEKIEKAVYDYVSANPKEFIRQ